MGFCGVFCKLNKSLNIDRESQLRGYEIEMKLLRSGSGAFRLIFFVIVVTFLDFGGVFIKIHFLFSQSELF